MRLRIEGLVAIQGEIYLKKKEGGFKYIKMYIKACKTEIFNWECVYILEDTFFYLVNLNTEGEKKKY